MGAGASTTETEPRSRLRIHQSARRLGPRYRLATTYGVDAALLCGDFNEDLRDMAAGADNAWRRTNLRVLWPAGANVALYLWQVAATGNANFWYFLGLAHSFSWAVLACKALAWFMPHRPSAVAKRKAKHKRD